MKAIQGWTENSIKTVTQVKGFLGLTQHYAIYMKHYAEWAAPLTDALKNRTKFQTKVEWNERMREGLRKIKEGMAENVMLAIANPYKPYILRVDASGYAVGAVLSQLDGEGKERPCAFFSRKLSGKPGMGQRGWSVREQETYAIVLALLKFRSWIASSQIEIICWSDHKSLEAWFKEDLGTVSGPLGRRGRWHEFLSSFNITVCYVKGEENTVADVLSRWTYEACQDNDTNMHGGEADLQHFLAKEKEDREYCRSVEQICAEAMVRPRDARDQAALNRWAVGMGLKHPDSSLSREKVTPLTWIDRHTPPYGCTLGGGVFGENDFECKGAGEKCQEGVSVPVRVATRSGRNVGDKVVSDPGSIPGAPPPSSAPSTAIPVATFKPPPGNVLGRDDPTVVPPSVSDPPPRHNGSTISSTLKLSPKGKKNGGTVGDKHENNPQIVIYRSWEDE